MDYDDRAQTLDITFRSGRTYTYRNVPPDVAEQLASSDSPGKFWRANIKDAFA